MNDSTVAFVTEKERKLELFAHYDVIVCGGGPAGIAPRFLQVAMGPGRS
jgi:ribulose 1,5-bisphosphate synthetase/thiazole synthase